MLWLIGWIIYGMFIGFIAAGIAKFIHPTHDNIGCLPVLVIGIVGAQLGLMINHLISGNSHYGLLTSIVGAIVTVFIYRHVRLLKNPPQ